MNNIFEELMTGQSVLNESVRRKSRKTAKKESKRLIPSSKLRIESMKILESEDYDELDDEFAKDPDEVEDGEVVLVLDPETTAEDEIPEDAAEQMVGDSIYKCPICGANYVCDCDAAENEALEVDEDGVPVECPVCGDDAEQILVGEIAPAEGAGDEAPMDAIDVDEDEDEEEEVVDDEEFVDDEIPAEDEEFVDEEDEEEVIEDSVKRRNESLKEDVDEFVDDEIDDDAAEVVVEDDECPECDDDEVIGAIEEPALELNTETEQENDATIQIDTQVVNLDFDEHKMESIMNAFLAKNYKNSPKFKVESVKYYAPTKSFKIEYKVVNAKGTKLSEGTLVAPYNAASKSRAVKFNFKDKGAFTESFTKTPSFVVEAVRLRNKLIPTGMTYNFKKTVNESLYRVKGKVSKSK